MCSLRGRRAPGRMCSARRRRRRRKRSSSRSRALTRGRSLLTPTPPSLRDRSHLIPPSIHGRWRPSTRRWNRPSSTWRQTSRISRATTVSMGRPRWPCRCTYRRSRSSSARSAPSTRRWSRARWSSDRLISSGRVVMHHYCTLRRAVGGLEPDQPGQRILRSAEAHRGCARIPPSACDR